MKLKQTFSMLLVLSMMLAFAACGNDGETSSPDIPEGTTDVANSGTEGTVTQTFYNREF